MLVPTTLGSSLELRGEAVAAVPCHSACPHLHHVASIGLQPVQPHRVLLARHRVGNAIALPLLQGRHAAVTSLKPPSICWLPHPPGTVSAGTPFAMVLMAN